MSQAAHLLPAAAHLGRVELRRMRWWDIPGVILLEHAAFPEDAWSVGMFWSELAEAATRYYLVAEEYAPAAVQTAGVAGAGQGRGGGAPGPGRTPRHRAAAAATAVAADTPAYGGGGAYGSLGDEGSAGYEESASASTYNAVAFAEDDEPRLIGYAGLLAGVGEAEVLTIAVAPAHEGRGLGAVLLTELMREAARRECDDVVLEVRVDNDRAQRLYRRFGFEGVGIRKGYYQPMNIDALVMRSGDVIERFGDRPDGGSGDGHGDGHGDGDGSGDGHGEGRSDGPGNGHVEGHGGGPGNGSGGGLGDGVEGDGAAAYGAGRNGAAGAGAGAGVGVGGGDGIGGDGAGGYGAGRNGAAGVGGALGDGVEGDGASAQGAGRRYGVGGGVWDGLGDDGAGAQGAGRNGARGTGMDSVNRVDWVRE